MVKRTFGFGFFYAPVFGCAIAGLFSPFSVRVAALFVKHTKTGNPLVDSVAEHQPGNPDAYWNYLGTSAEFTPSSRCNANMLQRFLQFREDHVEVLKSLSTSSCPLKHLQALVQSFATQGSLGVKLWCVSSYPRSKMSQASPATFKYFTICKFCRMYCREQKRSNSRKIVRHGICTTDMFLRKRCMICGGSIFCQG